MKSQFVLLLKIVSYRCFLKVSMTRFKVQNIFIVAEVSNCSTGSSTNGQIQLWDYTLPGHSSTLYIDVDQLTPAEVLQRSTGTPDFTLWLAWIAQETQVMVNKSCVACATA